MTDIKKCDEKHVLQMIESFNQKSQEYIDAYNRGEDILELVKSVAPLEQNLMWFKGWFRDNLTISMPSANTRTALRKIRDNEAILQAFVTAKNRDIDECRLKIEQERPGLIRRYVLYSYFGDDLLDAEDFRYIENSPDWQRFSPVPPTVDTSNTVFEDADKYKEEIIGYFHHATDLDEDELNNNPYYKLIWDDPIDFKRFYSRQINVGPIITGKDKISSSLFSEIRVCYALTQYFAAIIFCRSLLEEAVKEYIITRDQITSKTKKRNLSGKNLVGHKEKDGTWVDGLTDQLEEPLKSNIEKLSYKPRKAANEILHRGEISEKEMVKIFARPLTLNECAFESIKCTRDVIEELFP